MEQSGTSHGWRPGTDTFGARLALIRQQMGWGNVRQAALACDVPPASWRNWEHNGHIPRNYVRTCRQIAARTGVDVQWLAGLEGDAEPESHPIAS